MFSLRGPTLSFTRLVLWRSFWQAVSSHRSFLESVPPTTLGKVPRSENNLRFSVLLSLESLSARVTLEILHCTLVLLCFSTRRESAQIAAPPSFWVDLSRIEPIATRLQFTDHYHAYVGSRLP